MALEDLTGSAKYVSDLVVTNPDGATDAKNEGDNHIRGMKNVLANTLPNANAPITASVADLNATTNFEETLSATTLEVTLPTGKTLNVTDVSGLKINSVAVSATAAELNKLTGSTATAVELNTLSGVTSAIQTQIDTKANSASPTLTTPDINGGTVDAITSLTVANDVDIGAFELRALTLESDVVTGTAPLTVASTTVVTNLNADLLDGQSAPAGTIVGTSDIQTLTNKTLTAPTITGAVGGAITSIDINGGTINGITDLAVVDGGTGSSTAGGARTNLGLGTISTLAAPAGTVVGTTDTQTLSAKTLTSPVLNTGVSGTAVLDEDNMASDSTTQLATQQSIKAYVDTGTPGAWALISEQAISSDATIDFTGLASVYDSYMCVLDQVTPATNAVYIGARVGTGATPTWQAGSVYNNAGSNYMPMINPLSNDASASMSGTFYMYGIQSTTKRKNFSWRAQGISSTGPLNAINGDGGGCYDATTAVTAIRFFASSGNLATGTIRLYGLRT